MRASMMVRCEQCGHESAPRYHYCGMCGAKLPPPEPPPPPKPLGAEPPRPEPVRQVSNEPVRQVSGPSFLGLADEPSSSVSYLLEDELSESHWGRSVVLLIILVGIAGAAWHWHTQLRSYIAAKLEQRPNNQSESVNPPEPPMTASGSEAAAGTSTGTTPAEKPPTAVTDLPATQPATQNPAAGVQNAASPVAAQNPAAPAEQTSSTNNANEQPSTPVSAAAAQASTQSATTPAPENGSGDTTSLKQASVPASAVTKQLKPKVKEPAPINPDPDQLEAEGEKYLYGTGVPTSCSHALANLRAAADHGNTKADSVLGTMYATGHCVSRDLPLAYRWFAKALQQDPANARLQRDLQVLWNQMSADERQLAMRR